MISERPRSLRWLRRVGAFASDVSSGPAFDQESRSCLGRHFFGGPRPTSERGIPYFESRQNFSSGLCLGALRSFSRTLLILFGCIDAGSLMQVLLIALLPCSRKAFSVRGLAASFC